MQPEAMTVAGRSIGDAVAWVRRSLKGAYVETPEQDARRLVAAATAITPVDLIAHPERRLSENEWSRLGQLLDRRVRREPMSRILGEREFYGRSFRITPATLDPRPDSETLIEFALELGEAAGWRNKPIRILDVGTGSGCLLVTLLAELLFASGLGTDVSADALAVAAANAERYGLSERTRFELRRSLDGIMGTFDLVVCNPPYVCRAEIPMLAPEVKDYDPHLALDGGPDGLESYRDVARGLAVVVRGWALFEIGAGQAEAVGQILKSALGAAGNHAIRFRRDLSGHTRCVAVRHHS